MTAPLFALAEQSARERLLASELGGLLPGEVVVDLFCGAGGWGAGGLTVGVRTDFAVNHSAIAIDFHRQNHPWCQHRQGDAWKTRPRDVVGGRKVGLLLASAACTTHSNARGAAPISPRVHMLGWCIARWAEEVRPRMILVENVTEWKKWGPTIPKFDAAGNKLRDPETGKVLRFADPTRFGQHYRKWLRYFKRLGYTLDEWILNAPDFGEASRRKRLFIPMRCDGMPIVKPEPTRGPPDRENVRVLEPYRTAADVINWSDLGTSIFDRPNPLADNTLKRIAFGVVRHVIEDASPFVLRITQTGGGMHVSPVSQPIPTQTTREDLSLCTPVMTPCGGPTREPSRADEPLHTLMTREDRGVATPVLVKHYEYEGNAGQRVDQPAGTITTIDHHGLIVPILAGAGGAGYGGKPRPIGEPMHTVLCEDHRALVSPLLATVGYGERDGQSPRVQSVGHPLNTVVGDGKQGLVAPVMAYLNNGSCTTRVDGSLRTVMAGGMHAAAVSPVLGPAIAGTRDRAKLVAAFLTSFYSGGGTSSRVNRPVPTLTTIERHGLVIVRICEVDFVIVDILFRMLRVRELAAAMGFPPEYLFPRSSRKATQLIGNALSVRTAAALIGAMVPRQRLLQRREAVA